MASSTDGAKADATRKRVEELRAQARVLMGELPDVLKSKECNARGFCHSVLPVLMHDSAASIVERLRSNHNTRSDQSTQNGVSKDGLLDLRQYTSWSDACVSIGEALDKCVRQTREAAHSETELLSAVNGVAGKWNVVECESWRDFGDGQVNVVTDGNTLRLATCRKCQRVVSQQRFAAHWEQCKTFDYSTVIERSPTNLGAGGAAAGGTLKLKIGMPKQGQIKVPGGAGVPTKFVSKNASLALNKKRKGEEMDYTGEDLPMIEIEVITCDGCGTSPIYSGRYSCNQCEDFDLCEACYLRGPANHLGHDPTHDFCLLAIPVVNAGTGSAAKRSLMGSNLSPDGAYVLSFSLPPLLPAHPPPPLFPFRCYVFC